MQAGLLKRLGAYIIDIFIINILLIAVTSNLKTTNNYQDEINTLTNKYIEKEISYMDFYNQYNKLNYKVQKDNYIYYTVDLIMMIGYFIVFQALNKGQTIGKKILKLQIIKNDNSEIKIKDIIIRSIFIYNILSLFLTGCFIKILNMKIYNNMYSVLVFIETIFIIITIFFILYRKDKRGLHDLMANTKVISK